MSADVEEFDDPAFRAEVRAWLDANLHEEYAELGGAGGPGREHEGLDVRKRWERLLGDAGWIGLGWPTSAGGRGASLVQQVVDAEEYARGGAPARVGHIGENLVAPTLIDFGADEQRARFLPGIRGGTEL